MKRKRVQIIFILLLLLLGICGQTSPSAAQDGTILSVEPNTVSVPLGNQVQVALEVSSGVNVNEFDLLINYDSARLSLAAWDYGTYLSNLSCTRMINQPGLFELVCEQVDSAAVNGDGVLLTMTFNTLALGTPDVTITEAIFVNPSGALSYPARQGGVIDVTNDPTYTPTPTITYMPTMTHTITGSPASTLTPTSTFTSTPTITPTITATNTPIPNQTATPSLEPFFTATETSVITSTEAPKAETSLPPTALPTVEVSPEVTPSPELPQETVVVIDDEDGGPSHTTSLLRSLWRTVLWGVLILGAVVLLWILGVYLYRRVRKNNQEDLL